MRRYLIGGAAGAGVLVVVVALTWHWIGRAGPSPLEDWIGSQIVGVLEHYITPRVQFATLDYQAPRTVVVDGLVLTSGVTQIASAERMLLELAEVPRTGRPIKIERIRLSKPRLLFVSTSEGFEGWSDFVQSNAAATPESVPEGRRFSDVLVLRHVDIADGQVVYEEAGRPDERMTLPGINLALDTPPVGGEPGLYTLAGKFERPPVFAATLDAQVSLDESWMKVQKLMLDVKLDDTGRAALPPELQRFLRRHQVQGSLAAEVSGEVPLEQPSAARAQVHLELNGGRVALGKVVLPVGRIRVDGVLPDGSVDLEVQHAALHSGEDTIFSIERLGLTLAGLPLNGAPLDVQSLECTAPFVAFLRARDGSWRGWRELMPGDSASAVPEVPEAEPPADLPAIHLRNVSVENAGIAFATAPDAAPLRVDGLSAFLEAESVAGQTAQYALRGGARLQPFIELQVDGLIDPVKAVVELENSRLKVTLVENQYEGLDPQLRAWLEAHAICGELEAEFAGQVPLRAWRETIGKGSAQLRNARAVLAAKEWPVDEAEVAMEMRDGTARLQYEGRGLAGNASGLAQLQLDAPHNFEIEWRVTGVRLEETLRAMQQNPPRYAGTLSTHGNARGRLTSLPDSLSGGGDVSIRHGRLVNLPVVGDILAMLAKVRVDFWHKPDDQADVQFALTGSGVQILEGEVVSVLAIIRGGGTVGFDGALDLVVNAGMMEKVQSRLGLIGDLLGNISDRLAGYTVTGTIEHPQVGVRALGVGRVALPALPSE